MSKSKLRKITNEIIRFLTNRKFILNLIAMIAFVALVLVGVFSWLRYYTHHGQKKELPTYIGQDITKSMKDAKARSFEIIVNDSVHIVGKAGGIVQNQNPAGGSLVKEKRKIYVTTTKFTADKVDLSELNFYGENYAQVEAQLKRKSIYSTIKKKEWDGMTQNSVLEVWYNGKKVIDQDKASKGLVVNKGDTLEFVVSSDKGGVSMVPNVTNQSVGTARWVLDKNGFDLKIIYQNDLGIDDEQSAVIVEQDPPEGTSLPRGSSVTVTVKAPQ